MYHRFLGVLSIILVLLITGCTASHSREYSPLTFGVEVSMLPAVIWIAEANHYFEDEGLNVTLQEFKSGRDSFLAMLDGDVDISMVAPTPPMYESFKRDDFYLFSTFASSFTNIKVIANSAKGIQTAEDLRNTTIGTPRGTTGDYFVDVFLIQNRISREDVTVKDYSPDTLPDALAERDVDAIVIWEPHATNAQAMLGNNAVQLESASVYKDTFNFMVMKDFAHTHPKELIQFLAAIKTSLTFMKEQKEVSQQIVASRLGVDIDTIQTLWEEYEFALTLDQGLLLALENEAQWAMRRNLVSTHTIPNYLNYIYFDALEEVSPSAVTIIR